MAYLSLYRKWRPETFDDILGQEHVSKTLANAIVEDRVAHAYLFTGPRGTGKTSTARILAKALNCEQGPTPSPCGKCASCRSISDGSSLDVIEMDAASHSKVDETREILAGVPLATAGGRKKVYVIDEVHMLSAGSFNALLKTLEEPPPHVVFILATTEAHKVLQTIVSRTQRFDFRRITAEVLEAHLARVAREEKIDIEEAALAVVARHAEGSARDALSALDQLSSLGHAVTAADAEAQLGERGEDALWAVFEAIAAGDVGRVFTEVAGQVEAGADIRQLTLSALNHARSLLLVKTAPEAGSLLDLATADAERLRSQAESFTGGALLRAIDLLGKSIVDMRNAPNHRLLLEVALVRAAAPETDPSATGLLGRIERLERRLGIEASPSEQPQPAAAPRQPAPGPARAARAPAATASPGGAPARAATPHVDETPPAAAPPAAEAPPGTWGEPSTSPAQRPARDEPKEAAAEAPAPTPAAPAADVGLGHVRDAWDATLQEVKRRSRTVGAFLNPSQPVKLEDGTLVVEVQSEFHKDAMTDGKNAAVLADAVHAALGVRPSLRFAARGAQAEPAPAGPPDASAAMDDYAGATEAAADEHDPVELIKKGLRAEVVEDRIGP
ncbi:MAG TPA: DNA polymerase III subunit gamma/tau [Actinomycetota bacterium]|nr:DNA polymerase III subunit gamma/tau [Actinomycetota bacterium]